MSIKTIQEYKILVNAEMERQFSNYLETINASDESYKELVHLMDEFLARGGKRIRPYLAYVAYVGSGGCNMQEIISIATALEFLHGFLLIHDDIIDNDETRYGGKNISGIYRDFFSELGKEESKQAAASIAILAGDIAHVLSSRAIVSCNLEPETTIKILRAIQEITFRVIEGEFIDVAISLGLKKEKISEEKILTMVKNKTASYTFELPLRVGTIAARGCESKTNTVKLFSEKMGLVFQMRDDILGIFGNSKETGKPNDGDIREGKKTIMYTKAISKLAHGSKKRFLDLYGKQTITNDEILEVKKILEENNIKDEVEKMCDSISGEVRGLVKKLWLNEEAKTILNDLIEALGFRTS